MATDTLAHTAHAHEHGHHDTGPMKVFGFWIYLMSDKAYKMVLAAA